MARAYSTVGSNASGSSLKTLITIIGATTVRPRVFDLILGSQATPANQAAEYALTRFTAAGTAGSAYTPMPLDPSDVGAVATAGITHSAEPTYTATSNLLDINLNQQATFRWVASPGMEILGPATAANGLGLRLVAATAALVEFGNVFHFE